jgi:hypothetical protein
MGCDLHFQLCEIYIARLNDFYEKAAENDEYYDYDLPRVSIAKNVS